MRRAFVILVMLTATMGTHSVLAHPAALATPTRPPTYTIAELPGLGGEVSRAFAINNRGQIVGHADDQQGRRRAILWQDGAVTDLGALGGDHAIAQNISDAGLIVGSATTEPGGELYAVPTHAFLWKDGQMTDLGTLGGDHSLAMAANDAGQVVGASTTAPGQELYEAGTEAFLWENGQMTSLGTLGGDRSIATSITVDGQVVGRAHTATGEMRAFHWVYGAMTNLGALTGMSSTAADINAAGQIVGSWSKAENQDRAAMWDGQQAIDLGTQQGTWAFALDINDRGWIIGTQSGETTSGQRWASSFLWIDGEGWEFSTLFRDEPAWRFDGANGLNEAGQIVGYGTIEGQTRAFVMTPDSIMATPGADLCIGVAEWIAASELAMTPFNDALEATGYLQNPEQSLTPDQWQTVFEASKETAIALNAIAPPPAREAWHAAQLQLAVTVGVIAKANLEEGDASRLSVASLVTTVVNMDRAIANAPPCPPPDRD